MFLLLQILILLLFNTGFSQENCDTIFWSAGRKLSLLDYKNTSDTASSTAVLTFVKIGYSLSQPDDFAEIKLGTYFLPCRSFTRNKLSNVTLEHEQLHFDIAEYFKRAFAKKVSELSATAAIFPAAVKAIFRDVSEKRRAMESDYDRETNKGANEEEQKKWNIKVSGLLIETETYAANVVKVKMKD